MDTLLEMHARNAEKARIIGLLALSSNLPMLTYVDVGAAWGIDNSLIRILAQNKRLRVVGFEPDAAECAQLRARFPDDLYLPCGVGDEDTTRQFYVAGSAAHSSFLEPDPSAFRAPLRREQFVVTKTIPMAMRRFDSLIREGVMPVPDFVKIDAQGFELAILNGFGQELDKVLGFRMETQLRPMYKGQPLFADLYNFMRSRGFILRDLRPMHPDLHEVVELEIFFSREPETTGNRFQVLKIWELLHDIPPGRTVIAHPDGRRDWTQLPV